MTATRRSGLRDDGLQDHKSCGVASRRLVVSSSSPRPARPARAVVPSCSPAKPVPILLVKFSAGLWLNLGSRLCVLCVLCVSALIRSFFQTNPFHCFRKSRNLSVFRRFHRARRPPNEPIPAFQVVRVCSKTHVKHSTTKNKNYPLCQAATCPCMSIRPILRIGPINPTPTRNFTFLSKTQMNP